MAISERDVVRALAGVSVILAVVALGLVADHPSVRAKSNGDVFRCLATWDLVLNNAYNDPDGFPPLRGERVGERCVDRAHTEFSASLGAAAGAVGLALTAVVLRIRPRRRAPRENTGSQGRVRR